MWNRKMGRTLQLRRIPPLSVYQGRDGVVRPPGQNTPKCVLWEVSGAGFEPDCRWSLLVLLVRPGESNGLTKFDHCLSIAHSLIASIATLTCNHDPGLDE